MVYSREEVIEVERKYAVILGNLGNMKERFCAGYKENLSTMGMLRQVASIEYVRVNPPMLFINGTKDHACPLDSCKLSHSLVPSPATLAVEMGMSLLAFLDENQREYMHWQTLFSFAKQLFHGWVIHLSRGTK